MAKIKVLALPRYDQKGASSRIRFFSYESLLQEKGYEITYLPLCSDQYLRALYSGEKLPYFQLLKSYFYRFFFLLFQGQKYDILWLEKEFFPKAPTFVESFLLFLLPPVIIDYDDAVHLNYEKSSILWQGKIEKVMSRAASVVGGSPELVDVATKVGSKRVYWVPTPVQQPIRMKKKKLEEPLMVGWIGSPSTEKYLIDRLDLLKKMKTQTNIHFVFIGTDSKVLANELSAIVLPWSLQIEKKWLEKLDLGLMPLRDSAWERGKCSYKILLYMASGIPVLASPVGMNNMVVEQGVNGYLADSDEEWLQCLKDFMALSDYEYLQMLQRAQKTVEDKYIYSVTSEQVNEVFKKVLNGGR